MSNTTVIKGREDKTDNTKYEEVTTTTSGNKVAQDVAVVSGDINITNATIAVDLDANEDSVEVFQNTHDNLNTNANLQINDLDVSSSNPVPIFLSGVGNDTPTTANVSVTNSNTTVLAANSSRLGAVFYNDSATRAYLKFGATATTTDFTVALDQNDIFILEPGDYTGIVEGITASGTATIRVTETT